MQMPSTTRAQGPTAPTSLEMVSRSFFRCMPLPSESTTQTMARNIFEILDLSFLLLRRELGFPSNSLGVAICDALRPSPHYTIGSPHIELTAQEVQRELRQLANNRFPIESVHICHASHQTPLELPERKILGPLRRLMPSKILLNNIQLNLNSIQASLETDKQYYLIVRQEASASSYTLMLQDKVRLLVLPSHPERMLNKLQDYADRQLKIRHLYFTAPVPEHYKQRVAQLLHIVKPNLQSLITNKGNTPIHELARQLSTV